jgi:hypothetical protein
MSAEVAAFNIVTFPGLVLNEAVREYYVRKYEVPTTGHDIDGLTAKLEEQKEKKGNEEAFGENTEETVRRMWSEDEVYVDFHGIDEYEGVFMVTSVPFFVSSGAGFFFLLVAVLLSGVGVLYSVLPFWLGAAFAAHSFPEESAAGALWQRSGETDRRLRFVGYSLAAVSEPMNKIGIPWSGLINIVVLFLVAWYVLALI